MGSWWLCGDGQGKMALADQAPLPRFNVSARDRLMNGGSMDGRAWLALLGIVA